MQTLVKQLENTSNQVKLSDWHNPELRKMLGLTDWLDANKASLEETQKPLALK